MLEQNQILSKNISSLYKTSLIEIDKLNLKLKRQNPGGRDDSDYRSERRGRSNQRGADLRNKLDPGERSSSRSSTRNQSKRRKPA